MDAAVAGSSVSIVQSNPRAVPLAAHLLTFQQTFHLTDFFHQNPQTKLSGITKIKLFKQIGFICREIVAAEQDFANGILHHFDPHVGDTACQFRAYAVVYLALQKATILQEFAVAVEQAQQLLVKTEQAIQTLAKPPYSKLHSLSSFCQEYRLSLTISRSCFFLTLCRFLTLRNIVNEEEMLLTIDSKKLMLELEESKESITKIVNYYQKTLSQLTVESILYFFRDIFTLEVQESALLRLIRSTETEKTAFACYYGSLIILKHALRQQTKFVLQVTVPSRTSEDTEQFTLICAPTTDQQELRVISAAVCHPGEPVYVIRLFSWISGETPAQSRQQFIERLSSFGIAYIFLAYMSRHPQYPGKQLLPYRENPWGEEVVPPTLKIWQQQFLKHCQVADQMGCALDNPSLFFVRHCHAGNLAQSLQVEHLVPLKLSTSLCQFPEIACYSRESGSLGCVASDLDSAFAGMTQKN